MACGELSLKSAYDQKSVSTVGEYRLHAFHPCQAADPRPVA